MDGGNSPVIANPWPQQDEPSTPNTPTGGKSRRAWFTASPHKVVLPKQDEEDLPVLKLTHFTKKVMVCFDKVRLGASKTCRLSIENPFDYPQELVAEKFPYKKGFTIPEDRWEFDEMENRILPITWTPSEAGNVRELITFKCDGTFRLQVIILGTAMEKPQGKRRRGTFLFKKTNGNVTKAPGKVGPKRTQQINRTRVSQQPSGEQRATRSVTNPKHIISQKQQMTMFGKENIPKVKNNMLKEVLNPARQTMIISKKPVMSPKRSPLQERTSPFQTMDTSLVEITNATSPDLEQHTKRDTLSLCEGMSPLLQTSFVYCGDLEDKSHVADLTAEEVFNDSIEVFNDSIEVFNDSIEVAVFQPDPSVTVTKPHVPVTESVEDETNVKRLSKEAQATVTKEKAPSLTPPSRRQSRRALFGETLKIETNTGDKLHEVKEESRTSKVNKEPQETEPFVTNKANVCNDATGQLASENGRQISPPCLSDESGTFDVPSSTLSSQLTLPNESDLFPIHESTGRKKLKGRRLSDSLEVSPDTKTKPVEFKVPFSISPVESILPSTETGAELFPVHESVVTKHLTSKRKSDPGKPELVSHKKLKAQKPAPVSKPHTTTRKQLVSSAITKKPGSSTRNNVVKKPAIGSRTNAVSTTGKKSASSTSNNGMKSTAISEPNRGMTRTMMLRRAAAGITTNVSKPKPAKVKRPMKGVPMAKLNLLKPNKTALPRHPMPFAAKNMFYDERWIEKQEQGFTRWLNYVLTPDEDCPSDPSCKATKIDAGALFVEANQKITVALAPSKEDLSLRAYTARRKLNRLRRCACILFQSEPVIRVIQKVEYEVERGGVKIRMDRKIHADYGIKQKLLNMFLSYNPLWLRIGLETVYGEILPIQSNTDILGLSRFVVQRLLWNPDIAQKYVHPTVPGLYGPGYEETLCQFTLKKFLLLVFFLDRAKLTRLIDHDPCLFCKDSEYKSSREILLEFSRNYLQGEGDITKHLSYYGYVVTHKQTALDEFDFAVSKLSTALRCGVRLARVVELLTKNWTLSHELRVPAISRLQKIHNTDVAFKVLKEHGIDVEGGGVNTRAIVDGHREKTLELMWRIIFHFQVEVMLNEHQIREEIDFLKKNQKLQRDLNAIEMNLGQSDGMLGLTRTSRDSIEPNVYFKSPRLSLLLQWCQSVCQFYSLKVENFTVGFSDGRALCYLVHHYHPSLLALGDIQQDTTQTQYQRTESPSKSDADDSFDGPWANAYSPSTGKPGEYERLLANERHNYKMLYEKVRELGGIPMMIKSNEMSNTIPDEKVVIVYVSYLCSRLLDLRTETRAARTIQLKWRAYRLRHKQKERQVQIAAATKIQGAVRDFLTRRRHAKIMSYVIRMQSLVRGKLARKGAQRLRQERLRKQHSEAAIVIQTQVKGFLERRQFQRLKASAIAIQSALRGHLVRQSIQRQHQAASTIQLHYQAWRKMQQARGCYIQMQSAVIVLQAAYRGHAARRLAQRVKAARILQAQWRGYAARRAYSIKKYSAITIQAWYRMCLVRQQYQEIQKSTSILQHHIRAYMIRKHQRKAATTIQALVRGFLVRQQVNKMNQCAVYIQRNFKAYVDKKHYQQLKHAAHVIQTHWRATVIARQEARRYQIQRGACITIQAWVRGCIVRKQIHKMHLAATCIQANYRAHRDFTNYQKLIKSALVLQMYWRSTLMARYEVKKYQITRGAVITIQAWTRGFLVRQQLKKQHSAAVCIQANYRAHVASRSYQKTRKAAITLQTSWRATLVARQQASDYQVTRTACIKIQAHIRGLIVRKQIQNMHTAATCIQANYRAHRDFSNYQKLIKSALVLQMYWRSALMARYEVKKYQFTRGAVITIQAWTRGFLVRQQLKKQHFAAVCIQANYRAHVASRSYQKIRQATITLQTSWRATLVARQQASDYQVTRTACIKIQAHIRGLIVRKQVQKMHIAAVCIQANYRAHSAYMKYHMLKQSVSVLQTYWRATLNAKHQMKDYHKTRGAVITIQSWVRGHSVRKQVKKMNAAATCIQCNFRAHRDSIAYQRMRQSAISIQTYWKATLKARREMINYQITRGACTTIQAWTRGFLLRQQLKKQHSAAVCIQANYRAQMASRSYQKTRQAAITLQTCWRATLVARQHASDYQATRTACIKIQAQIRGLIVRKQVQKMHTAATCIQANYRAHRDFSNYQKLIKSALVLQMYWRSALIARYEVKKYQITKGAVITIQAWTRGFLVRQELKKKHSAAVCIQANYKAYVASRSYQKTRKAAITLQTSWRATLVARQQASDYQVTRTACIKIQAHIRGLIVRNQIQKMHTAAICIQANYRAHSAYKKYHVLKQSVSVLQAYWRATLNAKHQMNEYHTTRDAVITIQSWVRGHNMRKQIKKMNAAATCIQCNFRAHHDSVAYQRLRQSAVTIQTYWRATLEGRREMIHYQITRGACITIQAWTRGFQSRQHIQKMHVAATCIQSKIRRYQAHSRCQNMKKAASTLQVYWRAILSGKEQKNAYTELKKAAIILQAAFRGRQARELACKVRAARAIQAMFRMHQARCAYLEKKQAAIKIQAKYRAHRAQQAYLKLKSSAIVIQNYYRGVLLMRQTQAQYVHKVDCVVKIQSTYRMFVARRAYLEKQKAAVKIQAVYKAHRACKEYKRQKQAAITIQKYYRGVLLTRQMKSSFGDIKNSAIVIQSYYRMHIQSKEYLRLKQAAVVLQAYARGRAACVEYKRMRWAAVVIQTRYRATLAACREKLVYQYTRGAVITIQAVYRGYQVRKHLRQTEESVKILQVYWRATLLAKHAKKEYQVTRRACVTLQAAVRGFLVRQRVRKMHLAATCIQANYRAHRDSCRYQKMRQAAICLQSYWRATLKTKEQVVEYQNTKHACVTIQACVRGFLARQQLKKMNLAAVCIQKNFRAHHDYKHYQLLKQSCMVLQKYWRATLNARQQTRVYQTTRGAVITIQARTRGYLVRQQVKMMHQAAVCIQSNVRAFMAKKCYLRKKQAAQTIQMYWRATLIAKQQAKTYQITRGACITIQAWVRGFMVRHQVHKMHLAATCIQTNYRAHRDYSRYQHLKKSAVVLQMYWRLELETRQQVQQYQITREAVITVQAWVRGFIVRQQVKKMNHAATCIQANYRAHRDYMHYQSMKKSVVVLQTYWRSVLETRQQTMDYQIRRGAVITIQAWARGIIVRQQISRMHHAATCIQSNYRAHRDQRRYQKMKQSALVLQMYLRSAMKTKEQVKQYQVARDAVITMQAAVRGFLVRQALTKQYRAAICIQATYRGHLALKSYQQTKRATVVLQKYWRATLLAHKQTGEYEEIRQSCIMIQAYSRGFLVRQQVRKMHTAATCIQANYRAYLAHKKYQSMRQAAAILQTYWRATLLAKEHRRAYQVTRGAVITLQACCRGYLVRQQIKNMNAAATCIQSNFRTHRDATLYQRMRCSAITIQKYWRATLLARNERIHYQITRGACITIQAWVRGFITRRRVQKMHAAATCIQSNIRAYQACSLYQNMKRAASVLQTRWRSVLMCRKQRSSYEEMRRAAIVIQAVFRGRQARCCAHKEKSARTIQAMYRMHLARRQYLCMRQAAVMIQANYRAHAMQQRYQTMRSAAIVIQQRYRGVQKMRQVKSEFEHTMDSIVKIQSVFRMFADRKLYLQKKSASVTIQAAFRMYVSHKNYQELRQAAVIIQKSYRTVLLTRQTRTDFMSTKKSVVKIQSCYRMCFQRRRYTSLKQAVTVLQAYARGKAACMEYRRMKHAAVVIQTRYRATQQACQQHLAYQCTRRAVVTLQAAYRGYQARKHVRQIRAAISIQAAYRGFVQKRHYQAMRSSVIVLQAVFRGHQTRVMMTERRHEWSAAVCIQKAYREYVARKEAEALRRARLAHVQRFTAAAFHHLSAIKLQRVYRNYCIMKIARQRMHSIVYIQQWWRAKLQRLHFTKIHHGITLFQRVVRQHQKVRKEAAIVLQSYARVWLAKQYVKKIKASTLRIQCMWRGYKVRKSNKSKKVATARARCMAANAAATEEKKLCHRTTSALDYLLQYKNLSYILEALINLDVVTRLSPICCERLVEGKAVPVLYTLIRSCNRSQACKEVIKYGVSILLNLVKYPKTTQAVFDAPDSVTIILDLMQMYREKGSLIFCQTCLLLSTLSHDPDIAKAIQVMPNITDKIKSIHRLTERKHKMDSKRAVAKQRALNASSFLNSSCLNSSVVPGTTLKRRRVQPDWVLGHGRMREIQDPMHAIKFLMDSLGLLGHK